MKIFRSIVSAGALALSLAAPRVGLAQSTTTAPSTPAPVVSLNNGEASSPTATDLKGVPPAVAKLIVNFDALRDRYLLKQHLLLERLKDATTQEQRQAIREQLQDNRQAFLAELADFRTQLKDELKSVQGRVSNAEFLRIIGSASGGSGDHHHRGN
jgi:hypothetical protein